MKIIQLEAENFKRLKAVEIAPDGNVVFVGGKNGSGKSSVLDAIYVALVGRSVAPPKPIRTGEEECRIRLDLGELVITRRFTVKDGGSYTDSLKVETAEGLRYGKPQEVLDRLLGEIGFDPFAFVQMKPADQAETLLQMVPLSVDLDELAAHDRSDYDNRRDVNREAMSLKAQLAAIPKEDVPAETPDRTALQDRLASAAETNGAIERERLTREGTQRNLASMAASVEEKRAEAQNLRQRASALDDDADKIERDISAAREGFERLEPLGGPVDVAAIQTQLREADATLAAVERQRRRAELEKVLAEREAESERLSAAMAEREKSRQAALAEAKMPIDGLGFGLDEKGKPVVTFEGVPFEQASSAEQLRASTAIAMAGNPSLRVLRVKDGSLLDEESTQLIAKMAAAEDFQLWVEVVRADESVGVIMENGEVKSAPKAKAKAEAKAETADEGGLL